MGSMAHSWLCHNGTAKSWPWTSANTRCSPFQKHLTDAEGQTLLLSQKQSGTREEKTYHLELWIPFGSYNILAAFSPAIDGKDVFVFGHFKRTNHMCPSVRENLLTQVQFANKAVKTQLCSRPRELTSASAPVPAHPRWEALSPKWASEPKKQWLSEARSFNVIENTNRQWRHLQTP